MTAQPPSSYHSFDTYLLTENEETKAAEVRTSKPSKISVQISDGASLLDEIKTPPPIIKEVKPVKPELSEHKN